MPFDIPSNPIVPGTLPRDVRALVDAYKYLHQRGCWCRGEFAVRRGRCLIGAVLGRSVSNQRLLLQGVGDVARMVVDRPWAGRALRRIYESLPQAAIINYDDYVEGGQRDTKLLMSAIAQYNDRSSLVDVIELLEVALLRAGVNPDTIQIPATSNR